MVNKTGENVLHIITRACHYGIAETVLQFIVKSAGAEAVTKLINQKNTKGESSVHYAASLKSEIVHYPFEDRDLMRLLLQSGGDSMLEALDTRESAVHYCSKSGNVNVLAEIVGQMQPLDAQAACNKQAKVKLLQCFQFATTKHLIHFFIECLCSFNQNGWSPLLYACAHGHPDVIRLLLEQNARVDVFDESGTAALHLAAELGHEEVHNGDAPLNATGCITKLLFSNVLRS